MKQHNTFFTVFARILALALALLLHAPVHAQNYPVQTHVVTSGPYFNYLSYYGDQNNHLQVIVTMLDFTLPPVMARLRIRIEGPGYELYTNPNAVVGQPFLLEGGVPVNLSGIDLLPYLQQNNLIVSPQGLDINALPEGFTTICVDVIKDGTNQEVLSTNNCTAFPLMYFGAPTISPFHCGTTLTPDQFFYNLDWLAPLGYTPDGNSNLTYNFALYQWTDTTNFSIFQAAPFQGQTPQPIPGAFMVDFASNIGTNIHTIDANSIPLELGQSYVWYIQAVIQESNGSYVNMIANNGISTPCTFKYGESLSLAEVLSDGLYIDLFADPSSENKGLAKWDVVDNTPNVGLSTFDQFFVEYRKQPIGNEGFEIPWFSETLTDTFNFIYQLEPSTTYEVKVSGIVGGIVGDPTPVKTFTTLAARIYACGESDLPFLPSTFTPLENATAGIQVQIGQFKLDISELTPTGSTGHYEGKGTIPIAFLAGAKAKVTFEDILIDTEYKVREGRVDVITQGLENWLNEQYQQFIDPIYVNGTVDSAYVDSNGVAWVVVDGVNQSFTFDPPTYPIIINDASGYQYTIYPNGTIVISIYLEVSEYWTVSPSEVVHFGQNENEARGFDSKEFMQWHEQYEVMQLSDSSFYFVANKSMAANEADVVNVQLPPSNSNISFQFADGSPVTSAPLTGTWMGDAPHGSAPMKTLTIPARSAGVYQIHAYANNTKVGQLNVFVYSKKEKELVVVPLVSNFNLTDAQIEAELKATLGEANIDVDVTVAPQWNDTTFTASTTISLPTDVGLMNKYSEDMKALRDAYLAANPNADKDKFYLFMVSGFDDPNTLGYMVRGRSMGFVKASSNQAQLLQTISHELGHGMGALEHTFKDEVLPQGSTSNLMDYSSQTNLTQAQWKELRDADFVPSLFDEVEDGLFGFDEYVSFYQNVQTKTTIEDYAKNNAFYLLNGRPYKFAQSGDKRIRKVVFDRLGRVYAFETEDFEYYEAYITRVAGSEVPLCRGYITLPQTDSLRLLGNGSTYLSAAEADFIEENAYQFSIPNASDSVYSRGCLFMHNGQSGPAFNVEIFESCLVDRTTLIYTLPTSPLFNSSTLAIPPSFTNNNYTVIEGGASCTLPSNIASFNFEGYGADIYFGLREDAPNQTALINLANYFSTLAENYLYTFYDDETNAYEHIGPSPDDPNVVYNELNLIPQVFKRESIYSISAFKAKYPRSTWFSARGNDSIISERDIRANIPEWYNAYSIDYTTFDIPSFKDWSVFDYEELAEVVDYIEDLYNSVVLANPSYANNQNMQNTLLWIAEARSNLPLTLSYRLELRHNIIAILNTLGAFDKYKYSLLDLVARESLVQNGGNVFLTAIQNKEQDGMAGPINGTESYTQYVNRFDTESAFFLGFEYMKMYVENFFEPAALLNVIQKASAVRNAFKSHKASYSKNLDDIFKGLNSSDELADAWKNGWTKEQVLAIPNGSRPNPNVYLKQEYIDNHIAQFNQEGGAFVVVESWIQNGSHSAFPIKKFAMLNSDMQNALLTYRQTGQVSDLETALGYNPGDLMGLEDELYVFYPNSSAFDFQMPNGNEIGANNLWEPGGKTSGNYKEAVLINKNSPTSPIIHNKSIEVLKSQFNWEKL